jgi:hypothetical protein
VLLEALGAIPDVEAIKLEAPDTLSYRTRVPRATNPAVIRAAVHAGADVIGLSEAANSLEEFYLSVVASRG